MMNLRRKYRISLAALGALSILCIVLAAALLVSDGHASRYANGSVMDAAAMDGSSVYLPGDTVPGGADALPASGMAGAHPQYEVRLVEDEVRIITDGNAAYTVLPDIDARTLRAYDRHALEGGIVLNGDAELSSFLEDFGS